MDSRPGSVGFRWSFNSSFDSSSSTKVPVSYFSYNDSSSLLSYEAKSSKDFGYVQCWAHNELGESSRPCTFKLIEAGKKSFKNIYINKSGKWIS